MIIGKKLIIEYIAEINYICAQQIWWKNEEIKYEVKIGFFSIYMINVLNIILVYMIYTYIHILKSPIFILYLIFTFFIKCVKHICYTCAVINFSDIFYNQFLSYYQ